jgi:hypothetical protein
MTAQDAQFVAAGGIPEADGAVFTPRCESRTIRRIDNAGYPCCRMQALRLLACHQVHAHDMVLERKGEVPAIGRETERVV